MHSRYDVIICWCFTLVRLSARPWCRLQIKLPTRNLCSESTNLRRSGGSRFRTLDSRSKSVHKFASNPTDRQTNRQTDRTKNITSFFGGGNKYNASCCSSRSWTASIFTSFNTLLQSILQQFVQMSFTKLSKLCWTPLSIRESEVLVINFCQVAPLCMINMRNME